MKVIFVQHGGQAAGINLQRPPLVIDTAALDPATAVELKNLVAAASSAPSRTPNPKARDEMSYKITIQEDGRETVLSQSDTTMSAEFGKLLAWLRRRPAN
jgi:hypothetical protein